MSDYTIEPSVDAVREFLEIAGDFTNPLELVREGISNAMDAGAQNIELSFVSAKELGQHKLIIEISDDGAGMSEEHLQAFFDLGNSPKRGDPQTIGEKGHGTKVYLNCERLTVDTVRDGVRLIAEMTEPQAKLHTGVLPLATVAREQTSMASGTKIRIAGFNSNKGELFTHERIKDYIKWFTKFGSCERVFSIENNANKLIKLKGLDRDESESIPFGHEFPDESKSIAALFEEHLVRAPDYYCRRFVRTGSLRQHPSIKFQAVFSVEGNKVKQASNAMLRRAGYQPPRGGYVVTDRYGVWLAKDFIPVERKNHWVSQKGNEYVRFHAFVNCQDLSLTANRGSVANTAPDVLADLEEAVRELYDEITSSDEWREMEWLESEAESYLTKEKEVKEFKWRKDRVSKSNIARYKGTTLVEPQRESGVYALLIQLSTIEPAMFPFEIVDYDTHSGIDVIAKPRGNHTALDSALFYVELKNYLSKHMNHSFENMRYIVCWDTDVKHGDFVVDLGKEERILNVLPPEKDAGGYTGYFLRKNFKQDIEIFVLKDYLRERHGIEFRPRSLVEADLQVSVAV